MSVQAPTFRFARGPVPVADTLHPATDDDIDGSDRIQGNTPRMPPRQRWGDVLVGSRARLSMEMSSRLPIIDLHGASFVIDAIARKGLSRPYDAIRLPSGDNPRCVTRRRSRAEPMLAG
jgi:hypothetical protein